MSAPITFDLAALPVEVLAMILQNLPQQEHRGFALINRRCRDAARSVRTEFTLSAAAAADVVAYGEMLASHTGLKLLEIYFDAPKFCLSDLVKYVSSAHAMYRMYLLFPLAQPSPAAYASLGAFRSLYFLQLYGADIHRGWLNSSQNSEGALSALKSIRSLRYLCLKNLGSDVGLEALDQVGGFFLPLVPPGTPWYPLVPGGGKKEKKVLSRAAKLLTNTLHFHAGHPALHSLRFSRRPRRQRLYLPTDRRRARRSHDAVCGAL